MRDTLSIWQAELKWKSRLEANKLLELNEVFFDFNAKKPYITWIFQDEIKTNKIKYKIITVVWRWQI